MNDVARYEKMRAKRVNKKSLWGTYLAGYLNKLTID
jgi:hypothetical protein